MSVRAYAAKSPKAKLEPFEYNPSPLGPDEVDIRVTHCGICHSDVSLIDNDWHFTAYPLVPGHEVIGHISAVGSRVEALKVGTRVGLGWQCGSCGSCEWCTTGQENFCAKEQDTIVQHHGGFADSVRCKWNFAMPIPDGLDSAVAGPLMCAGSTVFSPMLHFGVNGNMRAAVVGIGGLGHLAVQYLAALGCDVTAISSSHNKDEEARKFGASHFIATRNTDELKKAAGSFDFILSTVSADVNWPDYLAALRPHGRLCIVGIPEHDINVSAFGIIPRETSVTGGRCGSPSDTAAMLNFTARHGIKPMCEFFPMKDINAAVDHVRAGKARFRAVLVA